jgi:hypothetical protein
MSCPNAFSFYFDGNGENETKRLIRRKSVEIRRKSVENPSKIRGKSGNMDLSPIFQILNGFCTSP